MRLDEYIDSLEPDETAERRRLAREKSYAITDYIEDVQTQIERTLQGDALFGSTAPSIFVGRSNYPRVSTGVLSPVGNEAEAADFATSGGWYAQDYGIEDVVQRRSGLLNSSRIADVKSPGLAARGSGPSVHDVWDGFVGAQREIAIAGRPVDVEIGLQGRPNLDVPAGDDVAAPQGPRAQAESVDLTENPYVPRPVEKTLADDDWQAQGAMVYLYEQGFDVYEINRILSAGALGEARQRRLVPTRWSITAVDDTVGQYLRGRIRNAPSIDETQVWENEYVGNRYWVILAPGRWEFELVEMKAPGSVWNPDPHEGVWMGSAHEGYEGRSRYVEETAGAYYASRLGVLEYLDSIDRQAKCLVLREVSDDYWAPVGVWQVRESVRNAFEGESGSAESLHDAVRTIEPLLPVSLGRLRRKSELVAGVQVDLSAFAADASER